MFTWLLGLFYDVRRAIADAFPVLMPHYTSKYTKDRLRAITVEAWTAGVAKNATVLNNCGQKTELLTEEVKSMMKQMGGERWKQHYNAEAVWRKIEEIKQLKDTSQKASRQIIDYNLQIAAYNTDVEIIDAEKQKLREEQAAMLAGRPIPVQAEKARKKVQKRLAEKQQKQQEAIKNRVKSAVDQRLAAKTAETNAKMDEALSDVAVDNLERGRQNDQLADSLFHQMVEESESLDLPQDVSVVAPNYD